MIEAILKIEPLNRHAKWLRCLATLPAVPRAGENIVLTSPRLTARVTCVSWEIDEGSAARLVIDAKQAGDGIAIETTLVRRD